ncbi:hypothetical protein OCOJLMKI_1993 [Methylobacterium iners]|uniref:Transposase n=1 Tax=Methylobacterium iners TaxID=418707 RepID=A0ABQ4RX26_9HYPH|nr:hypothetical protein OCOJLMKI_1993 [Methylobacterium iners]
MPRKTFNATFFPDVFVTIALENVVILDIEQSSTRVGG